MADLLTRAAVLSALRRLPAETVLPDRDPVTYGLVTDRMAAYALLLRELPAEPAPPVVEAPMVEPTPAQDPECPYPPVLTRWGLATWANNSGDHWRLYTPECVHHSADYIAYVRVTPPILVVYSGRSGDERKLIDTNDLPVSIDTILAALRELGSLPDEVSDG